MNWWKRLFPDRRKQLLDEELQGHLRMAIEDRIAQGQPRDEAHASAMKEFGNLALVEDVTREQGLARCLGRSHGGAPVRVGWQRSFIQEVSGFNGVAESKCSELAPAQAELAS